jgi:hypothetical protein
MNYSLVYELEHHSYPYPIGSLILEPIWDAPELDELKSYCVR